MTHQREIISVGKDGWLFLTGGSNDVLGMFSPDGFSEEKIANWVQLIERRKNRLADLGSRFIQLVAPEKLSVYPEFMELDPGQIIISPISRLDSAVAESGLSSYFINPLGYFLRQKLSYQLYFKTDSHWNFYGCFCAYQLLCARLGVPQNQDLTQRPRISGDLVLDLGGKRDPAVSEQTEFAELLLNAERTFSSPIVKYKERAQLQNEVNLHVGSSVIFSNTSVSAIPLRVVLFGDSFSEYRTHLLTGMLAETVSELHFIWSTSLDYDYIDKVKPDLVISELAERFLSQVPSDKFNTVRVNKEKVQTVRSKGNK